MATTSDTDALGANVFSVALIGPQEQSRMAVGDALAGPACGVPRQLPFYPDLDQVPKLLELNFDVIVIELDTNPETALELVETLCADSPATTVMVYSSFADSELMIRSMRAGAREFLTRPFTPGSIAEAMVRAAARRTTLRVSSVPKRPDGKLCVFFGAKGGTGVTTLASNFAVSVASESGKATLLIDLDLPFGDVALGLGLSGSYSTVDALQNHLRLDSNFLSRLLVKHESGLSVLAAPGKVINVPIVTDAVNKLISVARQDFEYVVVDTGSRLELASTALFGPDASVYLVSQVGLPELRNSNRIISELFKADLPQLEIVLNRYAASSLGIDEEHITRALTRRAQWKIPDDQGTVRKLQGTATPLVMGDSQLSRTIRQMARVACGLGAETEKKRKIIGLF